MKIILDYKYWSRFLIMIVGLICPTVSVKADDFAYVEYRGISETFEKTVYGRVLIDRPFKTDFHLDVEYGCFQLVRHVAQILFAELLDVFEPRYLLVVVRRPCRQLLRYVLDMLVAKLVDDLARVHVAREHDRVYWFELVGHVFADDEQRREHHDAERSERQHQHIEPRRLQRDADRRDDQRRHERDEQRSALLGLDRNHAAPIYSVP